MSCEEKPETDNGFGSFRKTFEKTIQISIKSMISFLRSLLKMEVMILIKAQQNWLEMYNYKISR